MQAAAVCGGGPRLSVAQQLNQPARHARVAPAAAAAYAAPAYAASASASASASAAAAAAATAAHWRQPYGVELTAKIDVDGIVADHQPDEQHRQ